MLSVRLQRAPSKELIYKLDAKCFPDEETPWFGNRFWWVALLGSKPVGYAALKKLETDRKCGYLSRAGVLPSHQRKGIHGKLLRARIAYARRIGLTTLITYTSDDNYPSMNSLVKVGFRFYEPEWAWAGRKGRLYLSLDLRGK